VLEIIATWKALHSLQYCAQHAVIFSRRQATLVATKMKCRNLLYVEDELRGGLRGQEP